MPYLRQWTYFQICSYLGKFRHPQDLHRTLTDLESACYKKAPLKKATSLAYSWLQRPGVVAPSDHWRKWSEDLDIEISDEQWRQACVLAHTCSISSKLQETSYKLLTRWYITPTKLHKWNNQKPDIWWRCQSDRGTLVHIWWHCPQISPFWAEVRSLIKKITETTLNLTAACCLLNVTNISFKKYKRSLSRHMLNAARYLIPLHWNSSRAPSIAEWLNKVDDIHEMEHLVAQDNGTVESFHKTWQQWLVFKYSQEFITAKSSHNY